MVNCGQHTCTLHCTVPAANVHVAGSCHSPSAHTSSDVTIGSRAGVRVRGCMVVDNAEHLSCCTDCSQLHLQCQPHCRSRELQQRAKPCAFHVRTPLQTPMRACNGCLPLHRAVVSTSAQTEHPLIYSSSATRSWCRETKSVPALLCARKNTKGQTIPTQTMELAASTLAASKLTRSILQSIPIAPRCSR